MGYIYKVTHKTKHKVYIGQTIQKPEIRWRHHINAVHYKGEDNKFHRALKKYGKDSFVWEIIEEVDNKLLDEREEYWITYFDSFKNGYNSTPGSTNPPRNDIAVICLETKQVYKSAKEASDMTNINKVHIAECARGANCRVTAGGYHWMQLNEYLEKGEIINQTKNEKTSKPVACVEENIIYPSILAASKATKVKRDSIRHSCEKGGEKHFSSKYTWRFA